jgi:hypothetical protein
MAEWLWITKQKGFRRKLPWPDYSVVFNWKVWERQGKRQSVGPSSGWDLYSGPPEYETGCTQWTSTFLKFKLVWWGMESNCVHSSLRPLIGLLCQPRVIMMMVKLVEWLARETEVLGENLSQCRFVYHKPHMLPGREPGPPRWEASD